MPQPASARLSLIGPSGTDPIANGDDIINAIIAQLDPIAAIRGQGVDGSRPTSTVGTPGIAGRIYFATDTGKLYLDTGTSWVQINPTIETVIAPTFQNAWANFDTTNYAAAGYFKDSNGIVYLTGTIKPGGAQQAAFTLPAGYRPAKIRLFPAVTGNSTSDMVGRVNIAADGTVTPWTIASGTGIFVSLDSIRFRAEQ